MKTSVPARIACAIVAACLVGPATAREIHYGAADHPEVLACDALHWRGDRKASADCYQALLRSAAPAPAKAEAAWAQKDLQGANNWFRQAVRAEPDDARLRTRWGDLYADSHQDAEAMKLYMEALQRDSSFAFAKLGAARVLAGGFDDEANAYLEPLLTDETVADGARVGAWLLLARVTLENGNTSEAREALDTAEALVRRNDWPPLEVYALRASADLLDNVPDSRWTERALEFNPHYGGIFAMPAHFYVVTRRYRDAIDLYQEAVDIEPDLAAAHVELGVNLLRDNQMSRARRHLEIAYREDPFSPKTVNTLRLMDSFSNFRLITDPPVPDDDVTPPITLRLHKDEADVVAPYAVELARRGIAEFTSRYGFELAEPVVIEMYPDHEDFAVRTAGMPGLGILGATFGYLVAMDSPTGRPGAEFQWGNVLWHEMAHVFTLESTAHLVPRWFSEGVSVLEEWRSGPHQGVRIPMSVYQAMRDDKFLPLADLDRGFVRPSYPHQVMVSYMQAGLVCQFIDRRFGPGTLREMLRLYAAGQKTPAVIEAALEMSTTDFDREFEVFVESEHGGFLERMDEWLELRASVSKKSMASDWSTAVTLAEQAISIFPGYSEPDSPYLALAQAHEALGGRDQARDALEAFFREGGYVPSALKQLATWYEDDGRTADAIGVLQLINLVQPIDEELHGWLGELLLDAGESGAALREFEVALALDPHDRAIAYYRLARAHQHIGNADMTRDNLLLALDVAPSYRPAQKLLLELTRTGFIPK